MEPRWEPTNLIFFCINSMKSYGYTMAVRELSLGASRKCGRIEGGEEDIMRIRAWLWSLKFSLGYPTRPREGVISMRWLRAYWRDESGQTSTEYILLLVVAAIIVFKFRDIAVERIEALTRKVFDKAERELKL